MNIRDKKMLHDWNGAEQRMAGHRITESSRIVTYTKGVIAFGLFVLFAFLLWI